MIRIAAAMMLSIALMTAITATSVPAAAETDAKQADPVKVLVARLDLERYKATIKGLTQFGDRRQGTDRNRAAVDWIEAHLKRYGCSNISRVKYTFSPGDTRRPSGPPIANPARTRDPKRGRPVGAVQIAFRDLPGSKIRRRILNFRRARDQIGNAAPCRLANIPDQFGHARIARRFGEKIDHESGGNVGRIFGTMRGEKHLERFEQAGGLARAIENLMNLFLVPVGHSRNHVLLVLEIAINQADADPGFSADIVHARLVETALGKTRHRGIENLGRPVKDGVDLRLGHGPKQ